MDKTTLKTFFVYASQTRFSNVVFNCQFPRALCTEEHSSVLSTG